jgi:hypothetical protein
MSEPSQAAANLRTRITSVLLGTVQLPGWAMLLLAIVIGIPDWKSRYEFWISTAQSTGQQIAMLAPLLSHPYFPGILAIAGIIYLVIVGYPGESSIRHKFIPIFGWLFLAVIMVSIITTAGFGAIEIYIRKEIAR